MRQDYWTNTTTGTEMGNTGPLGSPRGWLRRAYCVSSLDDHPFQAGAITPYEISVGGVWYRPCSIPDTSYRTLYRFFDIPTPEYIAKHINTADRITAPAIGVAVCAPVKDLLKVLKLFKDSGAAYTWWKTPENKSIRASFDAKPRRTLDHAVVYELLEQGLSIAEIARKLDFPSHNIDYVAKKWRAGAPLSHREPYADKRALLTDYANGLVVPELVEKYKKSPAYIYALIKRES